MVDANMIRTKLEEKLEGSENYLVDIRVSGANDILIELDSDNNISIEDCIKISRYVEHELLDREKEDFQLEVTSAGLDKPFRVLRQYEKNIESNVKVVYNEGGNIEGLLKEVSEEGIVLETKHKERVEGKKKKVWVTETHDISFDKIKETKVVITF